MALLGVPSGTLLVTRQHEPFIRSNTKGFFKLPSQHDSFARSAKKQEFGFECY